MYRIFLTTIAVFFLALYPAIAQEEKKAAAPDKDQAASEKTDAPKLEDAGTVAEIQAFLGAFQEKLQAEFQEAMQKAPQDVAVFSALLKRVGDTTVAAGKKMLQVAKSDEDKETGYTALIEGYKTSAQSEKMGKIEQLKKDRGFTKEDEADREKIVGLLQEVMAVETEGDKQVNALLDTLEKEGKYAKLVDWERFQQFAQGRLPKIFRELQAKFDREVFDRFKDDMKKWAGKNFEGADPDRLLMLIVQLAETEGARKADPEIVGKTIRELTDYLQSPECTLPAERKQRIVEQFAGHARRCIGAELKLYGKTLDDKDLDWNALRGKYVLVQFTASWCGPCKLEIPGMLESYEKYRGKGFEIVSVFIWDKLDDVRKSVEEHKLPWTIVSEELTEKAKLPPQGKAYAIGGVPTMLLVDKEGKVVSTEARGPQLQEKLAELLGK